MREQQRRLSDKIISAHELACQLGKLEVADILLQALKVDLSAIGGGQKEHRQATELLEQVFERHQKAMKKM